MKNPDFNPDQSTVYVCRYTRIGAPGCSFPCVGCWAALDHIGLKTVVCYDEFGQSTKIDLKCAVLTCSR